MIVTCPSIVALEEWLGGTEPNDEFAEHVAGCAQCQAVLDQLSDDVELRQMSQALSACDTDEVGYTVPRPARAEMAAPKRIGPYRLESEIGRGGMGVVYRAIDDVLNRTVALKLIRRDSIRDQDRERMLREARSAARVNHDNIVRVYAAGVADDGAPYLAMEYVAGLTVAEIIKNEQRLAPRHAAEMAAQVADGLAAAHAAGLVHRDIKPSNILIGDGGLRIADCRSEIRNPKSAICKLTDFGIVRDDLAASVLTMEGTIAGTPAYLSPEQACGKSADARSDVYGLGVTLYESLIGEVPFRGPPIEVLRQVLDDEPRPPRQIDNSIAPDLETITLKALAKEPARRYQTANEFAADLRRWLNNVPILARPAGRFERAWRWCRRNPGLATLTGSVVGLLIALAVGGTTAAVLISHAYARADIDRTNAIASQKQAESDRGQALTSQRQAEAGFDVALKSLYTLVETVQKQMSSQPGLLTVRRQLLETAADGLNKIIAGQAETARTDQLVAIAHHRLGDVFNDLGRTAEAIKEYEAALKQSEATVEREPDNMEALRAAANACDRLGDFARIAKEPAAALGWYKKAVDQRRKVVSVQSDERASRELSVSNNKIGDAQGAAGKWELARQHFEESLRMIEQRPTGVDVNLRLVDSRATNNRLSDACVNLGDMEAAVRHADLALQNARDYITIVPVLGQIELAFALERRAWVATNQFDRVTAERCRREAVELRRAMAAVDPSNAIARRNVAYGISQLADVFFANGDFATARPAYVESLQIYSDAVAGDPDSVQMIINLGIAYMRVMMIDESLGRYADAAEWANQAAQFYQRCAENPKLAHLKLMASRDNAERDRAAYAFTARKGLADPAMFTSEQPKVQRKLLRLRTLALSRDDKRDEVIGAVAELNVTGDASEAVTAARALAKVGEADRAVDALREAIRLQPPIALELAVYPEYYLLCQRPDFLALRPKPSGLKN